MKWKNKRQVEVTMMVGAILLLFVGLPIGLNIANGWNGLLSGTYNYDQVENATAFYDGPILDGDDEHRYASVNGTTVTEETPTWDSNSEWDSLTLVGTGTNSDVYFNWNTTPVKLLQSKAAQLRMKFNGTHEYSLVINAVKFDGVTLTSVLAKSISHIGNESQVVYWNWTGSDLLTIQTNLNPDPTDEVYFQIILSGYNATNKLTAGDTIEFQYATGSPSNVYTFTSWQILTGFATLTGIALMFLAAASTPYWNPLTGTKRGRSGSGKKRAKPRKKRRRK